MSTAEIYGVMFAAIETADSLFQFWMIISIALAAAVIFGAERLQRSILLFLLIVYILTSLGLMGRWGIVLSKILELLNLLREEGEVLPPAMVSASFGLMMVSVFLVGTVGTVCLLWRAWKSKSDP